MFYLFLFSFFLFLSFNDYAYRPLSSLPLITLFTLHFICALHCFHSLVHHLTVPSNVVLFSCITGACTGISSPLITKDKLKVLSELPNFSPFSLLFGGSKSLCIKVAFLPLSTTSIYDTFKEYEYFFKALYIEYNCCITMSKFHTKIELVQPCCRDF